MVTNLFFINRQCLNFTNTKIQSSIFKFCQLSTIYKIFCFQVIYLFRRTVSFWLFLIVYMLKSTLFFSCIVVLNYFTLITFPVIHIFILLLSICFSYPFVLENFLYYFLFWFLSSAYSLFWSLSVTYSLLWLLS